MLKLNLISQDNKNEITLKRSYFLIKRVNFILIVFSFFMSAIFFGANLIIEKTLQEYFSSSDLYKNNEQKLSDENIAHINEEINTALMVQNDFFPTSIVIKKISSLVSNGIILDHLQLDIDKKTVKMGGLANSRENFLAFKNILETSSFLTKIDSPLTSILQKENIEFEISTTINLDKLKNTP